LGGISHAFLRLRGPLVTAKCQVQKKTTYMLRIDIEPKPILAFAHPDTTDTFLDQNGQIVLMIYKKKLESCGASHEWDLVGFSLEAVCGEENVSAGRALLCWMAGEMELWSGC